MVGAGDPATATSTSCPDTKTGVTTKKTSTKKAKSPLRDMKTPFLGNLFSRCFLLKTSIRYPEEDLCRRTTDPSVYGPLEQLPKTGTDPIGLPGGAGVGSAGPLLDGP